MLRLPQQHTGLGTDLTFEVPHWKVFPTEEDNSSTFQIFFNTLANLREQDQTNQKVLNNRNTE